MESPQARPAVRWAKVPRYVHRAADGITAALALERLQLAAKAGLAAGIAFLLAPLMPGSAADYPYYAPLGALAVMYHNVAGSIRQGLQALAGLATGIGLAVVLVAVAEPTPLTVALFMGLGVLLGGLPWIGSGSDWIPTAALLVLLVGGSDAGGFSFGYLVQMGAGVGVGLAVNFLVFPPLHLNAAADSLDELRGALGRQLADIGSALKEEWPPRHKQWSGRSEELAAAARSVRHLLSEADASRRANPRSRLHPRDLDLDYRNLRQLERITFHIQDMTEVLSDVIYKTDIPYAVPLHDNLPLADAISATGELLSSFSTNDRQRQEDLFAAATAKVQAGIAGTAGRTTEPGTVRATESLFLSLHRILRAARPDS